MKKIFSTIVILLVGLSLNAQEKPESFKKNQFGIRAGTTVSNLKFDFGNDIIFQLKSKPSFYVGGFWERSFNEIFGITAGITYADLESHFDMETEEFKTVMHINYFSIPIGVKYYANQNLSLTGGIKTNILASTSVKSSNPEDSESSDSQEFVKKTNLLPYIGAEYRLFKNLHIETMYNFGVENIAKDDSEESFSEQKIKLGYFQLGFNYKL